MVPPLMLNTAFSPCRYTPAPLPSGRVLREMVPPVMVRVPPSTYTPPPPKPWADLPSAVLPEMTPPLMVKLPAAIYTPPPLAMPAEEALLLVMEPSCRLKAPSAMYTPPPLSAAVWPVMEPPYMSKAPPSMYTPRLVPRSLPVSSEAARAPPYRAKRPPGCTPTQASFCFVRTTLPV